MDVALVLVLECAHPATHPVSLACLTEGAYRDGWNSRYVNFGASEVTILVEVVSAMLVLRDGDTTDFDLELMIDTPPDGDYCPNATALSPPERLIDQSLEGMTSEHTCAQVGPDRAYSVVVPPGTLFTAGVSPNEGARMAVLILAGEAGRCDTCGPASSGAAGDAPRATFANTTDAGIPRFILAAGAPAWGMTGPVSFTLTSSLEPTPVPVGSASCDTAPRLQPAPTATVQGEATYLGGSTVQYMGPLYFSTQCLPATKKGALSGRDLAYQVDVPAGRRLSVTVTPERWFDPAVLILQRDDPRPRFGCPGACLAASDDAPTGQPERLDWVNAADAGVAVLVVVDSNEPKVSGGRFDLSVSLGPP